MKLTFVTGNKNKVEFANKFSGLELEHMRLDLPEIQSLDINTVSSHKAYTAFDIAKVPVLIEDSSLELHALGKLPGTLIRFFVDELGLDGICRLIDGKSRRAVVKTVLGYRNATRMHLFEGILHGTIADTPRGQNGWDWDKIFIPDGFDKTRAEMTDEEYLKTYLELKRFDLVKKFLGC